MNNRHRHPILMNENEMAAVIACADFYLENIDTEEVSVEVYRDVQDLRSRIANLLSIL